jgi:hypothetical protein
MFKLLDTLIPSAIGTPLVNIYCTTNLCLSSNPDSGLCATLIKKKIKFSSYIRKFRVEQLQSHMTNGLLTSYMVKYLLISSYIRKPFLIYDFATAPL